MTKASMNEEPVECVSMIDHIVAVAIREVICEMVSDELGIDVMACRNELIQLLKDEREAPENIRIWFENNM